MMTANPVPTLLFDLALMLILAQALGALARRIRQPAVIGEILAGILLGPTLFNGHIAKFLFPTDVRPLLAPLANLGVALFMFLVGLELDRRLIAGKGRVMAGASLSSLLVPFGLGVALSFYLIHRYPTEHRLAFVLFMGVAMATTAFPVLAKILTDRRMQHTQVGSLALACAAITDVLVWSVLAAVVILAGGNGGSQWRIVLVVPYAVLMFAVVRPLLRRLAAGDLNQGNISNRLLTTLIVGVLVSGGFTEWIGLHFVFGSFLFGFIVPKDDTRVLQTGVQRRVAYMSGILLPVYFVTAGLKVDLSHVGASGMADLGLIMLVAAGSKFAGVYGAARLQRSSARESATLAVLLNTRGLTELVILTIGLQLGLLNQDLFSLCVAMAVITTVMTGPLLTMLERRGAAEHVPGLGHEFGTEIG
jgi:Kef-type K+ transport system membrane component KefB